MREASVKISDLINDNRKDINLRIIAGRDGLDREILGRDIHRPGLAFTGFVEDFPDGRIQLIGVHETLYLSQLSAESFNESLDRLYEQDISCIIITGRNRIFPQMKVLAEEKNIPLLTTSNPTSDVAFLLTNYLSLKFAPTESIHGTLVDVYGTGLLFIGRAGIGKSEIALDLIERGHRLVADDIVKLTSKPPGLLIGSGPELLKQMIEIRGVGVINVREIFGVRAIRLQKRVEVVVELVDWDNTEDYERLGMEENYTKYLGISIPMVKLPIFPGKNITVITEAIALNLHLKVYGYHAAQDLSNRLLKSLRTRERIANYLKWDSE